MFFTTYTGLSLSTALRGLSCKTEIVAIVPRTLRRSPGLYLHWLVECGNARRLSTSSGSRSSSISRWRVLDRLTSSADGTEVDPLPVGVEAPFPVRAMASFFLGQRTGPLSSTSGAVGIPDPNIDLSSGFGKEGRSLTSTSWDRLKELPVVSSFRVVRSLSAGCSSGDVPTTSAWDFLFFSKNASSRRLLRRWRELGFLGAARGGCALLSGTGRFQRTLSTSPPAVRVHFHSGSGSPSARRNAPASRGGRFTITMTKRWLACGSNNVRRRPVLEEQNFPLLVHQPVRS